MTRRDMVSRRGFTLIELMVVVAIIGIISSLVMVSLGSARAKARDAERKADIGSVKTALETYALDNKDQYPVVTNEGIKTQDEEAANWNSAVINLGTVLVPTYMAAMPTLQKTDYPYGYCVTTPDHLKAHIWALLEKPVDSVKPYWNYKAPGGNTGEVNWDEAKNPAS